MSRRRTHAASRAHNATASGCDPERRWQEVIHPRVQKGGTDPLIVPPLFSCQEETQRRSPHPQDGSTAHGTHIGLRKGEKQGNNTMQTICNRIIETYKLHSSVQRSRKLWVVGMHSRQPWATSIGFNKKRTCDAPDGRGCHYSRMKILANVL